MDYHKKSPRFRYIKNGNGFLVYRGDAHIGNVFQKYGVWWANNHTEKLYLKRHTAAKELLK